MELVVFTCAAFGLAYIVGHSKISLPVRLVIEPPAGARGFLTALRHFVLALVECAACFGFWTGLAYGFARWTPSMPGGRWERAVVLALYACSTNFILSKWTGLLEGGASE